MAVLTPKVFEELKALALAFARNRLPEKDWGPFSDNTLRLEIFTLALADAYFGLRSAARDADAFTAEGLAADSWGALRGVIKKGATPASGANAGRVRGTVASSWTTADLLTDTASGRQYAPTAAGSIPAAGFTEVGIIAQEAGSAGVLTAGATLEWLVTPAGLEDQVAIVADLDDTGTGLDVESLDVFRERYLKAWADPLLSGTPADYRFWSLESEASITTAFVWKGRNGKGTVDVAALKSGSNTARFLSAPEQTTLLAYITDGTRSPAPEQVRVLDTTAQIQNIEVTIEPEIGEENARDWDDSTSPAVLLYTSATRTLQFAAARPVSMKLGQRLVVDGTPGAQLTIQSLSSTDSVILDDDLGYTFTPTEEVYSGGGATKAARDAIVAHVDSLGPRRGTTAALTWISTLDTARIKEAASTATGVLDSVVITPSADVEPDELSFPDDTAVNLIVSDNVIVRYS